MSTDASTSGVPAGAAVPRVNSEWTALQQGALLVDRSNRLRMRFSGDKAAEALTGLVTSDVLALVPGRGQYSAALTPKGKVLADLRVFARSDHLLVDVNPAASAGFVAMIRKYVNPRIAKYEDISAATGDWGVAGAGASSLLRAAFGDLAIPDLPAYGHTDVDFAGNRLMIARVPDFGVDGFDVIGPRDALVVLRDQLSALGAVESSGAALEVTRIESGRPAWGVDMDDSMLAQEVDLDRLDAISFTKGCYTGQETVARVHYRGHVNRHLRGLRMREVVVPPAGAELVDAEGRAVGTLRSAAVSPSRGPIALALVRREIEPGSVVRATWDGGAVDAEVTSLPFTD